MTGSALRWILAVALAAGLLAGLWVLAAGRFRVAPGSAKVRAERLSGVSLPHRGEGRALHLSGSRRARGGGVAARLGGGLGGSLVEGGRPKALLSGIDVQKFLPAASGTSRDPGRPGRQSLAPESRARISATRARAAAAARGALGSDFAPQRRRIPGRANDDQNLSKALRPPAEVPRVGPRTSPAVTQPVAKPALRGPDKIPAPPWKRLPAPTVALPPGG